MLDLLEGLFDGMKPTEIITVSQWAEKYRFLSPEASFLGGSLYSCSVTPYAKKIMDCLSVYSPYKEVVFCKSSQTGGTEIGNNWLGYIMHICPGPTLMLMPTDSTVERNSKIRIDPMIAHSKELSERVAPKKSRDGDNTINQKRFPGGVLYMGGANSPAVLKSIPVRFVMLDEVDEYPSDLGGQGSADGLAKVRTRMFPNRKIYYVSTPTIEGVSLIQRKFLETDQNYYEVPCPYCGVFQKLKFEQLKWEDGNEDDVKYQCIHCKELIEERHKTEMLALGDWVPEIKNKVSNKRIGFHINSLYAPTAFFRWSEIVEEYQKAKDDPNEMKVFVNTILGETWAETSEAPKFENLYNRREEYKVNKDIPNEVCFLTAGVDIQKDRIELEIVGWCKDKQSYSIDYRVLVGKTALPEVWAELDKVALETWTRKDNLEMSIKLMAVDSGAYTSEVYAWCRTHPVTKVIPIKGRDNLGMAYAPPKQIDFRMNGKKVGKVKIWNVGSTYLKHELYSWLGIEKTEISQPCYCHFPQYDQHFFQSITAEDWIPAKKQWKKRYERNEALDCRVYARAASVIVGLDRMKPEQIEALSGNTYSQASKIKHEEVKKKRSSESIW